ncbi:MAG: VPDSG-CTERM sorting domain-containing protein [Chthoniobacterales bacterium]
MKTHPSLLCFRLLPFVTAVVTLVASLSSVSAQTITIAPGMSPAGGYLALSGFGVPAVGGVTDNGIFSFSTPSYLYAGQTWSSLGFASNGFLVVGSGFTGADGAALNQSFPNPVAPNNVLAPFWTNLDPSAGGSLRIATLTDGSNTWIVCDWGAVRNFGSATTNSFEVWIGITGDANPGEDITFVYGALGGSTAGLLTVGAEDITGTIGANYFYNGVGTMPTNGTQLRVTTNGFLQAVPDGGTNAVLLGLALASLLGVQRALAGRRAASEGA